jgi:hypothetical protein
MVLKAHGRSVSKRRLNSRRATSAYEDNADTAYWSAEAVSWLIFFAGVGGGYAVQKSECAARTDGICAPGTFFDYTMIGIFAGIVGSGIYLAYALPKKDRYRAF